MTTGYYFENIGDLKQKLMASIDRDQLKELHVIKPWRHLLSALRLIFTYLACLYLLINFDQPWIWIPTAVLQGFTILGFIILLHELVHNLAFRKPRPVLNLFLSFLYSIPSAIAPSQFKQWHLDHHDELGSDSGDPKRAHLSPKKNSRILKLLYFTPFLFLIYARASAKAALKYPSNLRRRIQIERIIAVLSHVAFAYGLSTISTDTMLRTWFVPLFLCFPVVFLLNRLGQHYAIDPDDPAHWSTRVDGHFLWRWLFVNSNHHIEHHYYPRVPHYHLPRLNKALRPFFDQNRIRNYSYSQLLWGWFITNKNPHSNWSQS